VPHRPRSAHPRWLVAVLVVTIGLSAGCATTITWTPTPVPLAPGRTGGALERVSCASADFCLAVSAPVTGGSFVERWDGEAWTPVDDPAVTSMARWPADVSCPAVGTCVVVGVLSEPGGGGLAGIVRLDATGWHAAELDDPPAVPLTSVSCATPDACLAVGNGAALRWDGVAWTEIPAPAAAFAYTENRVACVAPDACFALSFLFGPVSRDRILRWDGSSWTIEYDYVLDGLVAVEDVACSTPDRCVAVGLKWSSTPTPTGYAPALLERRGTTWHEVGIPAIDVRGLSAVACAPGGTCVAVGGDADVFSTSPAAAALVSRRPGSWSVGTNPPPELGLVALSCVAGSCMAVGRQVPPGAPEPSPTAARLSL